MFWRWIQAGAKRGPVVLLLIFLVLASALCRRPDPVPVAQADGPNAPIVTINGNVDAEAAKVLTGAEPEADLELGRQYQEDYLAALQVADETFRASFNSLLACRGHELYFSSFNESRNNGDSPEQVLLGKLRYIQGVGKDRAPANGNYQFDASGKAAITDPLLDAAAITWVLQELAQGRVPKPCAMSSTAVWEPAGDLINKGRDYLNNSPILPQVKSPSEPSVEAEEPGLLNRLKGADE